ncbi:FAD binding domain-containing protein [Mycobacterium sp. LTG2003]
MTAEIHPTSWSQAAEELADPGAVVVAGGTGVQPWLTTSGAVPQGLVHLGTIGEAWDVEAVADGLRLGAMVSVDHPELASWFGDEGAAWFATPAVRRRATVLGNAVSRIGPRELGPILVATGARILTTTGRALPDWQCVEQVLQHGLSPGRLAMKIELRRPERISYRRVSVRSRMSRVEVGLCAAIGPGCSAALVVRTGGPVHRLTDAAMSSDRVDFVAAARDALVGLPRAAGTGDEILTMVTGLAGRVHHDLHGPRAA